MKRLRWTRHAMDQLAARQIDRDEVERAAHEPTATLASRSGRTVRVRRFHDDVLGQEMLLCVVTEEQDDEVVIVTAYKTSRFHKYLRGTGDEDSL